jgi:hypothetical protein
MADLVRGNVHLASVSSDERRSHESKTAVLHTYASALLARQGRAASSPPYGNDSGKTSRSYTPNS